MVKTKIVFNKTTGREWFDTVTKFIDFTTVCPFEPVWDELTLYVDTYVIGVFTKQTNKLVTFKYNTGAEWINDTDKSSAHEKLVEKNIEEGYIVGIQEEIKVGDWVETCAMLPGIVTSVTYKNGVPYDITAYQPGYNNLTETFSVSGGCHSVKHCGVRRISGEYAHKLLVIGNEKLEQLWDDTYTNSSDTVIDWETVVNNYYNENFTEYKSLNKYKN